MACFVSSHSVIEALCVAHHLVGVSCKAKSITWILLSISIFSSMLARKLCTYEVPSYVGGSLTLVLIYLVSLKVVHHLDNPSYEP
jgi:hypothetical protein